MESKKAVLVIDDDEVTLNILNKYLTEFGYDVDIEVDSKKALVKLLEHTYDCVITDIVMPEKDGFSILDAVTSSNTPVPVVIISKFDSTENMRKAWKSGAFDFLKKPVCKESVRDVVSLAVHEGQRFLENESGRESHFFRNPPRLGSAMVDEENLKMNFFGDLELFKNVLKLYEDAYQEFTNAFSRALKEKDASSLKFEIHKLRGAASALYIEEFSDILDTIARDISGGGWVTESDLRLVQIKGKRVNKYLRTFMHKLEQESKAS